PERYRKTDEVRKWEENDPIGIFRGYLVANQIATTEDLDQQERLAGEAVLDAVEFAEASPEPAAEELYTHVYCDENPGG
ncbi:MAG: thiamine pyrophosphate-dependent enzyme, partial [Anaerolineaceae bacterium]|nr:thiamine pyrophosphate-dependent enzyme [Anaerolineaceae bacterium]